MQIRSSLRNISIYEKRAILPVEPPFRVPQFYYIIIVSQKGIKKKKEPRLFSKARIR